MPGCTIVAPRRLYHVSQVRWSHLELYETWTVGICSLVYTDVTAGWTASPDDTRPTRSPFNSWVDWSKFFTQGNNNNSTNLA